MIYWKWIKGIFLHVFFGYHIFCENPIYYLLEVHQFDLLMKSVMLEISTFPSGSKYYKLILLIFKNHRQRTIHANIISVIKITTLIRILHFIFILISIMISSVGGSVESHSFNFMEAGFRMSTRKSKKLTLTFLQRV